jgi:hypothetical protein
MRNHLTRIGQAGRNYLIGALLLSAAACSEPVAPESVLGSYGTTKGIAPVQSETHRYKILSITVTIDAERVTRTVQTLVTELASGTSVIHVGSQPMAYSIEGARIVTRMPPCPVGMACDAVVIQTPDYRVFDDGLIEIDEGRGGHSLVRITWRY